MERRQPARNERASVRKIQKASFISDEAFFAFKFFVAKRIS
jgi:hypothetical protein